MKIECWAIGKPDESYVEEGVKDSRKELKIIFLLNGDYLT